MKLHKFYHNVIQIYHFIESSLFPCDNQQNLSFVNTLFCTTEKEKKSVYLFLAIGRRLVENVRLNLSRKQIVKL